MGGEQEITLAFATPDNFPADGRILGDPEGMGFVDIPFQRGQLDNAHRPSVRRLNYRVTAFQAAQLIKPPASRGG